MNVAKFTFLGPLIAVARRRSVCPSVYTYNSATYVGIFFKLGGNIPWVNISRSIFRSTGPIAVARRRSVGRSVCLSVCLSTPVTRQPMFGFFSKSVGIFLG